MKTDEELIAFVFNMAGEILIEQNLDFINLKQWKLAVDQMDLPLATTYRIVIFNQQLMNGGILQYFDNSYAIFCHETIEDFNRIKAFQTSKVIEKCFNLVNPKDHKNERLLQFVSDREYEIDEDALEPQLRILEDKYIELEKYERLETLLGKYLRK